jgi:hypothetical protein
MESSFDTPTSRFRFLRQLGLSVAAGLGGAGALSRVASADTGTLHQPGERWAPANTTDTTTGKSGEKPLTLYCCLDNTHCIGTCPPGYYIFYCNCPSPYCICVQSKNCYPAPC